LLDEGEPVPSNAHSAMPRRREVLRAREEFCRLFFDANSTEESAAGLQRYFLAFGVAARAGQAQ